MKSLIFFLIFSFYSFADIPDWVINNGISNKYNEREYLTGYGISYQKKYDVGKATLEAQDIAKNNLIQKIFVKIESQSQTQKSEIENEIFSTYQSFVESKSSIELEGLNFELFSDDNYIYALAYINKNQLINSCISKINYYNKIIQNNIDQANVFEKQNNISKTIEIYNSQFKYLLEIEKSVNILRSINYDFANLKYFTADEIQKKIDHLSNQQVNDLEDIATIITNNLKNSLNLNTKISIYPFSYQNTKTASKFSVILKEEFETKFAKLTNWNVVKNNNQNFTHILIGTYWEQGEYIKIIANILNVKTQTIEATSQIKFHKNLLSKNNIDYHPANFAQAMNDAMEFNKNEVIDGGLSIDAWTNKGKNSLIFRNQEIMNVYIKVNLPSYIRFIYHQADGKRILLLDNYYIDQNKVNQVYKIPYDFEVSEPFGIENLQIIASTEKLPELKTDENNVIHEQLSVILTKTRGLKIKKQDALQAETKLTITTVK
ncbi:MAG TPA: DUF4384 domain-containing protein [Ignavibacteriales bacterium]|nr:DUF4384 domain-containing protein [Ignavibacteriales bacterium]